MSACLEFEVETLEITLYTVHPHWFYVSQMSWVASLFCVNTVQYGAKLLK